MNEIKTMMYSGVDSSNDSSTFRLERGSPFRRRGKLVKALPQFKGLAVYSPTSENSSGGFSTNEQTTKISYPSRP